MKNSDVRNKAKELNVYMYELADYLKMHENTLYRHLRKELSNEQKSKLFAALENIKSRKGWLKNGFNG